MSTRHATDGLYLIEPDRHFPFHDPAFSEIILQVIHDYRKIIRGWVQLGDFVDWWQLSEYDKDPRRVDFIQDDLQLYADYLDRVEKALPDGAVIHQLEGNHEDRLRRYIAKHARALVGIVPSVPRLLEFPERNAHGKCRYIWHPLENWRGLQLGDTVIHHGHYFNKHTAVGNLDRYRGVNIIHGHTHRVQMASNGDYFAATLGHGADPAKISHKPTPEDWQQAFGLLNVYRGKGYLEIYEVKHGCAVVRGKVYQG